jgi:hypothetical protein
MTVPSCSGSKAKSGPGGYLRFQSGCYAPIRRPSILPAPRSLPPGPPGAKRSSARRRQHDGAGPVTAARPPRATPVGSSQYHRGAPRPGPDPHPIADQARQRKASPAAAPVTGGRSRSRPPAPAVADLRLRRAARHQQQQPRRRRPVPDAFAAISRPGPRQARPRRNPAHRPQVIRAEPHPARHGETRRPRSADSTTFPYPRAGPETSRPDPPCSQRCAPKLLRGHFAPGPFVLNDAPNLASSAAPQEGLDGGRHERGRCWRWRSVRAGDGRRRVRDARRHRAVAATVVLPLAWPGSTARTGR